MPCVFVIVIVLLCEMVCYYVLLMCDINSALYELCCVVRRRHPYRIFIQQKHFHALNIADHVVDVKLHGLYDIHPSFDPQYNEGCVVVVFVVVVCVCKLCFTEE